MWDWLRLLELTTSRSARKLDWSRAVIDVSHVRAVRQGPKAGRARSSGSKHHALVDGHGVRLAVSPTGWKPYEVTQPPLLDKFLPVAHVVGGPRRRPDMSSH